jgi:predicted DNA-binding ribbon-helix-helix protein
LNDKVDIDGGSEDDAPQPQASEDAELVFRAVNARGARRGIRLERIFWSTLGEAAATRGQSLSQLVGDTALVTPTGGNLASALRVVVARWLTDRLAETRQRSTADLTFAMIQACPSPVFALSADKRIVSYNRAFVGFLQARFSAVDPAELLRGLRLSLDTPLDQAMEKLAADPVAAVASGYVIGLAERRVRGQLRLTLAPTAERRIVIAFVAD